ncbi:MAG: DNA polymerase domain-containing protein [Thermoplasmatota archaeon]|jgi:DNA polymerase elongation subunit (family B)
MLSGNILDTYIDTNKNIMVTWLVDNGKSFRVEDSYTPSFYVYSETQDLYALASMLRDLPQVEAINFTSEKIVLGSDKKKFVLEVVPKKIGEIRKLSETIDSWGGFYKYQLFNVDLRIPSRYLQDKGVFFNARVKWDGKNFILDDKQWAIDYNIPRYKSTTLEITRKTSSSIMSFDDPIKCIKIGEYVISEENEVDTILLALKHLLHVDPDIIYTFKGDSVTLPFLYYRAKLNGLHNNVNLGRDKTGGLYPVKQEKSYFSYGRIVYRPAFYTLRGRVHIDTYNSFLYGESGIHGLLDISRCSNMSLQVLSRVGPGTAISQIQVNKAIEKGYLIPWKKNLPEDWKTAMKLLVSDRGGLILDPVIGLHENVVELDFASLYPNIMLRYNISPETMLCNCCKYHPKLVVPQLGYHICSNRIGLLPEVLRPILFRRFCFKARSKNNKYDRLLYNELQKAWKWVLLVCFGYTGYKNARYGRIECYESITAFSRDIILTAVETAEEAGYTVLHGIIDSLWIKPCSNTCISPALLSRRISKRTGVRMDVEVRYAWIVFLPSKNNDIGALNRYYGLFEDGKIKIRGIEFRQRDSPIFLKNMQKDILNVFSKAKNAKEFLGLIPAAVEIVCDYGKKLVNNDFKKQDLLISTCVTRDAEQYKVDNLVKSALFQLKDLGVNPQPGQSISYVVCNEKSRDYKKRVCVTESLKNCENIDVDFYLRQVAMYAESILVPFGFRFEKLYDMLEKIKMREKLNVSVLPRATTLQTSI